MRKLVITLLAVIATLTVNAQVSTAEHDSLARKFYDEYNNENYSAAIEAGEKLATIADSVPLSYSDSLYVAAENLLGKSYYRANKPLEAAHAADKAAERMRKTGRTKEIGYAFALDNAGLYYNAAELTDSGMQRSLKALDVMSTFPDKAVSQDMYVILLHVAEACYYSKKYQDAIVYEIRALNIIEKVKGKYSDEYIDELDFLAEYYRGAGEEKKAEDIDNEKEQIKDAYDKGERDIPDADQRDLSSAEECHKYNYEALRCADFYLSHKLGSSYMSQCSKYLMRWSMASPDVNIVIGENEAKLLKTEHSAPYFIAYIAACTKYALENEDSTFSKDMFNDAMVDVLNFYVPNRDITGKVSYLEKYVDAYNKGQENLAKLLEKNYPKETK